MDSFNKNDMAYLLKDLYNEALEYNRTAPYEDLDSTPSESDIEADTIIAKRILERTLYYTPVKTGKLKSSIKIKEENRHINITVGSDYGLYVHEIMENRHAFPTKAKFLEDAAIEVKTELGNFDASIEYTPVLRVWINYNRGTLL